MPLRLKLASSKDFDILFLALFMLVVASAMLSPQPVLLTILAFLLFGAGLYVSTLVISNVNDVKLIAVIFPDGQLRLESGQELEIEGVLNGQQWCSHYVAVLRYVSGGKRQNLVILSAQQNADEYRRLKVWLRLDICSDTCEKQVSGILPASRV
jgi:uncharacterized protein (DUF58 family)